MAAGFCQAAVVALAASGCGGGTSASPATLPAGRGLARIALSSPAFAAGARLPVRFTCAGAGVSPPLRWSGIPRRARELVLVLFDPDAPGGGFTHWTLYGIRARAARVAAGRLPPGARSGRNSTGHTGYAPPCPPPGDRAHRYRFDLYALSRESHLGSGAEPAGVAQVIRSFAIGRGQLVGLFRRS